MEETIKTTVMLLKAALDNLETAATKDLHGAEMGEASVEVFWKYARPILEMSNALEKAGFLPGKPESTDIDPASVCTVQIDEEKLLDAISMHPRIAPGFDA